jgi:hypothetical protein
MRPSKAAVFFGIKPPPKKVRAAVKKRLPPPVAPPLNARRFETRFKPRQRYLQVKRE